MPKTKQTARRSRRRASVNGSAAPRDLRTPLAKARDKWLASEEGKRCLNSGILWSPHQIQYLENRLVTAFLAGVRWIETKRQNSD